MDDKYQVMPPLTDEEYDELKADIAEHGVKVAVEVDENGDILDGYHRYKICQELGITDYPKVVRFGMNENEKIHHALAQNLVRRNMSVDQKREVIQWIFENYDMPNAEIAKLVCVSLPIVIEERKKKNEEWGTLKNSKFPTSQGINGKEYPVFPEQRREIIRQEIIEHPEKSDREIARNVGADHKTVAKQREVVNEIKATFSPTQPESQPEPEFEPEPKRYEYSIDLGNVERDLRNSIEALDASLKYIVNPDNKMFGSAGFNQVITEQLNNCEDIINKYRGILNEDA